MVVQLHIAAQRGGRSGQSQVYLFIIITDAVKGSAAYIGFHLGCLRDGVDGCSALGDDGMEADVLAVHEGLADGVDGIQSAGGRIERILSGFRRTAGMGGHALEGDILGDTAVAALADGQGLSLGKLSGMDHHGHVNAVKVASGNKFHLSAEIPDHALLP